MNRILLFCFLLLAMVSNSQSVTISINISNQKGEPIQGATVTVWPVADSTATQSRIADSTGQVVLQLEQQLYGVRITSVEYAPLEKTISVRPDAKTFRMVMQAQASELNSVVVTARRPLMRQEDDKTIVD